MSQDTIAVLGVTLPAIMALITALWQSRKSGPEAVSSLIGSSTEFADRLMARIATLEVRVAELEIREAALAIEVQAYRLMHGPLPTIEDTPGTHEKEPPQ